MTMTNLGETWSNEELDFLISHYGKEGITYAWMVENKPGVKRTSSALKSKAKYLGLAKVIGPAKNNKAFPASFREDVADMALMGYTSTRMAQELSAQYGVSVSKEWVLKTIKTRLPDTIRLAWMRGKKERRIETGKLAWQGRAA